MIANLRAEMIEHGMTPGEQHEFGESHVGDGFVIALDHVCGWAAYGWVGTWETHDASEHRSIATINDALALRDAVSA